MKPRRHIILCECGSVDHHVLIEKWDNDDETYLISLNANEPEGLTQRIKKALSFVLRKNRLWLQHDTILDKKALKELKRFMKKL